MPHKRKRDKEIQRDLEHTALRITKVIEALLNRELVSRVPGCIPAELEIEALEFLGKVARSEERAASPCSGVEEEGGKKE